MTQIDSEAVACSWRDRVGRATLAIEVSSTAMARATQITAMDQLR